ncbi:DoxX family protein [Neptuniibacter sp. QD37_6]|uniref:DoxX family protein n=1 Tax=Neptuniibacter sp. QD37_6 TaxID=3398210 RepID=UPI0039F4881E
MNKTLTHNRQKDYDEAALYLRLGLGILFIIGGVSKLSQLLSSAKHDAIVANYMGSTGYINELFQQYLFTGFLGELLTPPLFLTSLSAFELISGIALVVGFLVRPLALIYAFLLWSFVFSLPVMTVPDTEIAVKTYTSPAMFVQIRDIALSGMMFVLFNLGPGRYSLDLLHNQHDYSISWEALGLLLRLSIGIMFLVSGSFGAFAKVPTFATWQPLLLLAGLIILFAPPLLVRTAGAATVAIMLWYMGYKLNFDKNLIANLNSFKREFAFLAAGIVFIRLGGGERFALNDLITRVKNSLKSTPEAKITATE